MVAVVEKRSSFIYRELLYLKVTVLWHIFYVIITMIIAFTSLALKGIHRRLGLYKVFTHTQGNLEANEEPRITDTEKTYSRVGLEPHILLLKNCDLINRCFNTCTLETVGKTSFTYFCQRCHCIKVCCNI